MPSSYNCRVDFNVDDRPKSLIELIRRLSVLDAAQAGDHCQVDLSRCEYLGPDAVAVLASIIMDLRGKRTKVEVVPPSGPMELKKFWHASGMEALAMGATLPHTPAIEPGATTLPAKQYQHVNVRDADPIIMLLNHFLDIDAELEDALRLCVNEVIQNVMDHARSLIGGVMCARFMQRSQQLRVAIVDRGLGIQNTLARRFPQVNAQNVLPKVIAGYVSALSRENNMGLGISNLCGVIEEMKGHVFIVSHQSSANRIFGQSWHYDVLNFEFSGTGVFFTMPTDASP